MKRALIAGLVVGLPVLACSTFVILGALERFPIHTANSPSGKWTAQLHALAEGDSVSYGQQLVVFPAWSPLGRWWSTTLFRGRCTASSELEWLTESTLVLSCGLIDEVEIQHRRHEDVRVEYVIIEVKDAA